MKKETPVEVEKVWGEEIWLVNNELYCGKLLLVNRNAHSSYHCHHRKRETFMALEGCVLLIIEGKEHILAPFTRPKTIEPGEKHKFVGQTAAVLLEVSTHHEDSDVERFSESRPGTERNLDIIDTPCQPQ